MLNKHQKEYLTDLINVGMGQGAASLSEMVGSKVILKVPEISVCRLIALPQQFEKQNRGQLSAVRQRFSGSLSGVAFLIFSYESAKLLSEKLLEETLKGDDGEVSIRETITEVGNIIINSFLGLWSHIFPNHLEFEIPAYIQQEPVKLFESEFDQESSSLVVSVNTCFIVQHIEVTGTVLVVFDMMSIETLVGTIDRNTASTV